MTDHNNNTSDDTEMVRVHESMTLNVLRADVAEVLHVDPTTLGPHEDLFDRGLDSVRLMALLGRWRTRHTTRLEFADLAECPELAHWAQLLDGS